VTHPDRSRRRFAPAPALIAAAGCVLLLPACRAQGDRDILVATGTIEAVEVRIASKIPGEVRDILVEEGARVKRGDVLALIDHAGLDLQLRQAEAAGDLAQAQAELVRKGARAEDIRQAEEALKQAAAGLEVAAKDAGRVRELALKGGATVKQKDDAEARLAVAQAQHNQAAELLKKVRTISRPEEIRAADARLAQAQAAADLLRSTILDGTVTAPADGVITRRLAQSGEYVIPGAGLLVLSRLDSVYVMIYLTTEELGRVRLGDAAEIRIDAFPDRPFPGRVTYISPEAEFTPKNVQTKDDRVKLVFGVKVEIPNPEGLLKPGLPADAVIRTRPIAPADAQVQESR
jgi:HlyD family secretion protein